MKLHRLTLSLLAAAAVCACQKTPAPASPSAETPAPVLAPAKPGSDQPVAHADKPAVDADKPAVDADKLAAAAPAAEKAPEVVADQSAVVGIPIAEFPALDAHPDVRVLEEGTGDKKALRYHYSAGSKHVMLMRLQMGMSMKVGERTMPPVDLPAMLMRAVITMGQPDGELMPYEFAIPTAPEVEAKEGTSEAVIAGLKASLGAMTGLKGTASVDARGATQEGKFVLDGKDNPQLAQLLDSMGQSMRQMSIPLPETAVGVGARWQARQRMQMGGMTIYQVGEYALESMDGDKLKLKVKLTQLGPKQTMDPPGLPPGVKAELLDMRGAGEGTMDVDLTSLVPVSEVKVTSNTSMRMTNQGVPQDMTMTMTMDLGIKPGSVE